MEVTRELMNHPFVLTDYLRDYDVGALLRSGGTTDSLLNIFDVKKAKVLDNVMDVSICQKREGDDPVKFEWPFGGETLRFMMVGHVSFIMKTGMVPHPFRVEGWSDFPESLKALVFHGTIVSSLKGIERLQNLEELTLNGAVRRPFHLEEHGVLRLLKLPKLRTLGVSYDGEHKRQHDALSIVKKHLELKDIVACQSELLDAGLEEYAKL